MPLSRIALQSPAGAARGQADDIQNEAKELSRIRDYLFNELAKNTGQPAERVSFVCIIITKSNIYDSECILYYDDAEWMTDLQRLEQNEKVQRGRSYRVWTY